MVTTMSLNWNDTNKRNIPISKVWSKVHNTIGLILFLETVIEWINMNNQRGIIIFFIVLDKIDLYKNLSWSTFW